MNPNTTRIITYVALVLLGIVLGLLIAHGLEKKKDFDALMEARAESPDPEKFDRDFEAMADWLEEYKREHPEASDADAQKAFEQIWKG